MGRGSGWRRTPLALAAMTLLLAATAAAAAPAIVRAADPAAIQREVEAIREQTLLQSVDPAILSRDDLRTLLIAQLRASGDGERLQRTVPAQAALGLMPADTRIVPLAIEGATVGLVGLYIPERNEMLLIGGSDDGDLSAAEEWTYAHELVHALQDQRFDLDALFARQRTADGDARLALSALIEGDATVVDQTYLEAHPELRLGLLGTTLGVFRGSLGLPGAPPVLAHAGLFPYVDGAVFVRALRDDGGWAAVDAAYADPPASTEQILHPEKYIERDEPTTVALPDPTATFGADWTERHRDTLGELQTAVLLAGQDRPTEFATLPEAAKAAAAGWDGDRYALWQAAGKQALVWRSVWDTPADAAAFATALRAAEVERTGGTWTPEDNGRHRLDQPDRIALIEIDGAEVRYAAAPTDDLAIQVIDALAEQD